MRRVWAAPSESARAACLARRDRRADPAAGCSPGAASSAASPSCESSAPLIAVSKFLSASVIGFVPIRPPLDDLLRAHRRIARPLRDPRLPVRRIGVEPPDVVLLEQRAHGRIDLLDRDLPRRLALLAAGRTFPDARHPLIARLDVRRDDARSRRETARRRSPSVIEVARLAPDCSRRSSASHCSTSNACVPPFTSRFSQTRSR